MYEGEGTVVPLNQVRPILDEPVVPIAHIRTAQAAIIDELIAIDPTLLPGCAKAACRHIRDRILHFAIEVADGADANVA